MDPMKEFDAWFQKGLECGVVEPSAMTLATVGPEGRPSARVVLLKEYDEQGVVFYTNYESRKGRELAANPHAALVLWWPPLGRQLRLEGPVERVSREQSEAYFRTRPLGSRLSAWASRQSEVIESRAMLERRVEELAAAYADGDVPLPPFWGGYRLRPTSIEFWEGRENRLHDRRRCTLLADGTWQVDRLSP